MRPSLLLYLFQKTVKIDTGLPSTRRATSALDAASESLVNKAISNISQQQQLTTILIAHRLSTLKTADTVVMMEHGIVAEQGTYDELSREGTRFNHLVRSQLLGGIPTAPPLVVEDLVRAS